MANALYKKLNEQVEINKIKADSEKSALDESVRKKAEKEMIFEDSLGEIVENLNFKIKN